MLTIDTMLPHLPAWLLVLFRLSGLFFLAPVLGASAVPMRIRVFLAAALSLVVYPLLLEPSHPAMKHMLPILMNGVPIWRLLPIIALELGIGVVIGYAASLPLIGMQIGGRVIDQQLGLGLAGIYNADIDEEAGVVGQFYFMAALVVFVIIGGHRILVMTLVDSFGSIPPGQFAFDGRVVGLIIGLLSASFEIAVRVAAPVLCIMFLQTVAIGFIARTVPQMNILSIGFPLRVLLGVTLVIAAVSLKFEVFSEQCAWMLAGTREFFADWQPQ